MKTWQNILLGIVIGFIASAGLYLVVSPPRGTGVQLLPAPSPAPILVQVDGAVLNPGVYALQRSSRVQDAIQAAGGFSPQANQAVVNLVTHLKDGDRLLIPASGTQAAPLAESAPITGTAPEATTPGEATPATKTRSSAPASAGASTPSAPVNLNTATLEELDTLPGIGPSRAQDIIDYRQAHGGFKTIDEIQNVKGIGEAMFQKLKDLITVN